MGHGGGIFGDDVVAAQAFLLVTSLWALTLAVVMHQQRLARTSAQDSERRMRDAIAAGRGFTFDYDPQRDHVRRADPDHILAPFNDEPGSSFFERLLPDDRQRLIDLVTSLTPARPTYEATYGSRRPDGRVVWLQERGIGEFDADGSPGSAAGPDHGRHGASRGGGSPAGGRSQEGPLYRHPCPRVTQPAGAHPHRGRPAGLGTGGPK